MTNLKKQLRTYLDCHAMTPSQLSRKSGVPNATIADWLVGAMPRNLDQVRKVAVAFGTTIDHLVYGSGIETPADRTVDIDDIIGDQWAGGTFELKIRRIRK